MIETDPSSMDLNNSTGSHCRHNVAIGDECKFCGLVGGVGPGNVQLGQYWAARGGDHWEHEVVSIGKVRGVVRSLVLEHTRTGKTIFLSDAVDLFDEFFYVGSVADDIEVLINAALARTEKFGPSVETKNLGAVLHAAWMIMSPGQRKTLLGQPEVLKVMQWAAR